MRWPVLVIEATPIVKGGTYSEDVTCTKKRLVSQACTALTRSLDETFQRVADDPRGAGDTPLGAAAGGGHRACDGRCAQEGAPGTARRATVHTPGLERGGHVSQRARAGRARAPEGSSGEGA